VDLWWRAVEEAGATAEIDNEVNLVLAECYPLVNTARSVQDVYVDAHLHPSADREYSLIDEGEIRHRYSERTYLLPDDECDRLRDVARSRNVDRIREELEGLFLGDLPPRDEMPVYREAARAWIGNGIVALRANGREGLVQYTGTVDEWIRKLRRRGGLGRVRLFLNMFAYQCKAAFYLCYASAWVGILHWLAQNREQDVLGTRFMRLWHNQNQAPEDERGVSRDAFCGQVLALHPLSAIVLTAPEHLAMIGRWIGHPDYEQLMARNEVGTCEEYWGLVATILIAAHEYEHSRSRWDETRGQPTYADTEAVARQTGDAGEASVRLLFEDFAAARGIICPHCSEALDYAGHEIVDASERSVSVEFHCPSCNLTTNKTIGAEDIGGEG